jgi:NitT/TauT family transport system ATP-binding protein
MAGLTSASVTRAAGLGVVVSGTCSILPRARPTAGWSSTGPARIGGRYAGTALAAGPRQARQQRPVVAERTEQALQAVGLTRVSGSFPHQLSGGMQQRVAIARVLANKPSVLLMDEPFGALDALTRVEMQHELQRIQRAAGITVLFVTHSIEEAVYLGDRVMVMAGGTAHGMPGHVREIVDVDLPADRDASSPEFNAIERHVDGLVHAGHAVRS